MQRQKDICYPCCCINSLGRTSTAAYRLQSTCRDAESLVTSRPVFFNTTLLSSLSTSSSFPPAAVPQILLTAPRLSCLRSGTAAACAAAILNTLDANSGLDRICWRCFRVVELIAGKGFRFSEGSSCSVRTSDKLATPNHLQAVQTCSNSAELKVF